MRRAVVKVVAVVVLGLLPFAAVAGEKKLTSEQKEHLAGKLAQGQLASLQAQKELRFIVSEPTSFLIVKPDYWKGLKHQEKVDLGKLTLDYIKALAHDNGKYYDFVFISEYGAQGHSGFVWINENRVEIKK